ncbi:MAG TPA: hypothetical protein VJ396_02815 [Acidiferrobacterales bacterium]|nr:hypothetical protein [Acidiferrobacterales bacterium]
MQILDLAVEAIRKQGAKGRVNAAPLAAKLEAIAACGDQAARVWQGYLDKPGAPGDKYTIVSWIGAERARQLYELSLQTHVLVKDVCAAAGDQARFLVLDESPIALAYRGLKEGETGPQAAQVLLAEQQATNKHLRALADKLRAIKPVAAKPAARAVKKPAAKKAAPKAAKKKSAPKKKAGAGKPAGKKAVKKAAKKK